ncbi:hypothetical protein C8Q76DRAFT_801307 [Earliella scabrosa]|nr:hypothetical protein C8Q76DRAFT_801307 [Earliella scabrosa]
MNKGASTEIQDGARKDGANTPGDLESDGTHSRDSENHGEQVAVVGARGRDDESPSADGLRDSRPGMAATFGTPTEAMDSEERRRVFDEAHLRNLMIESGLRRAEEGNGGAVMVRWLRNVERGEGLLQGHGMGSGRREDWTENRIMHDSDDSGYDTEGSMPSLVSVDEENEW